MNKDDLRKIKWVAGIEYYYGDTKLTKEQSLSYEWEDHKVLIEEIGEENFNKIKPSLIYEYGYFHQWVVENCGDVQEGLKTNLYALVETEKGKVYTLNPKKLTFID